MKPKPQTKNQPDYTKCRIVGVVERDTLDTRRFTIYDDDTCDILRARLKNFLDREVTITIELGDKLNPPAKRKR